ncbi:MAG: SURF1 family protein [Pseudomonadales bacterium]|nr:SURF1 family protein [Pseudomonadales bacterium]
MSIEPSGEEAPVTELAGGLRFNTKFAALVVVLFPILMGLAGWQLWRSEEKAVTLAAVEARSRQAPVRVSLLQGSTPAELHRLPVVLRGRYLQGRDFLLDNRILRGAAGYELITPFQDRDGTVVFVNRGWRAALRTREQLPRPEPIEQDVQLIGDIYAPEDLRRLRSYASGGWPCLLQAVDIPEMARIAGVQVFPYLVRLRPDQPGVRDAHWEIVNMSPERHVAYAAQWFLMGLALLVVFLLGGTNIRERYGNDERSDKHHG